MKAGERVRVLVSLELPEGVTTPAQLEYYVREAVRNWWGQQSDPKFTVNASSVRATYIREGPLT